MVLVKTTLNPFNSFLVPWSLYGPMGCPLQSTIFFTNTHNLNSLQSVDNFNLKNCRWYLLFKPLPDSRQVKWLIFSARLTLTHSLKMLDKKVSNCKQASCCHGNSLWWQSDRLWRQRWGVLILLLLTSTRTLGTRTYSSCSKSLWSERYSSWWVHVDLWWK